MKRLLLTALMGSGLSGCPFGKKVSTELKVTDTNAALRFDTLEIDLDLDLLPVSTNHQLFKLSRKNSSLNLRKAVDENNKDSTAFAEVCTLGLQVIQKKGGDLQLGGETLESLWVSAKKYAHEKNRRLKWSSSFIDLKNKIPKELNEFYLKDLLGDYTARIYKDPNSKTSALLFVNDNSYGFSLPLDTNTFDETKPIVIELQTENTSEAKDNVVCHGIESALVLVGPNNKP